MRYSFLVLLLICSSQHIFAQKPVIDSTVYNKWTEIAPNPILSNDGRYAVYSIRIGSFYKKSTKLIIQSTGKSWKIEFLGDLKSSPRITSDSKYCLFITQGDSLATINFKDGSVSYIPSVSSFNIPEKGTGEWMTYELNSFEKPLFIRNFKSKKEIKLIHVSLYELSKDGKILIVKRSKTSDSNCQIDWINLTNDKSISIFKGNSRGNLVLASDNSQVAFIGNNSIWYYRIGMAQAFKLINLDSTRMGTDFKINYLKAFSKDNRFLFVTLAKKPSVKVEPVKGSVEIWSYRDSKLQSAQEDDLNNDYCYDASICLANHEVTKIQKYENEDSYGSSDSLSLNLYSINGGNPNAGSEWNSHNQPSFDLVNIQTGTRERLPDLAAKGIQIPKLSPCGKYIVYYDKYKRCYFCYNIKSSKTYNLTNNIRTSWLYSETDYNIPRGVAAWFPNDEAILVYDSHDIWKLDPTGKLRAVNLTNGYGLKNKIIFNLSLLDPYRGGIVSNVVSKNERIILSAFDQNSKDNGFFSLDIRTVRDPAQLIMGPHIYKTSSGNVPFGFFDFTPIKAKHAKTYIVRRMSPNDAPNYFVTSDFKVFKRLTDLQPQRRYNWYTTELHNWKSLDGRNLQGILYKPENFDKNKKYPVIFYYYEKLSDGLNAYLQPDFSSGYLDIPSYVSQGYLVFSPDIYYKTGDPMQGTYDAVTSAAKYLSTLSFVNPNKMGVQGHSFGGIQTNYLITQTNLFAAACSSSGMSDDISGYGSLTLGSGDLQPMYELGQNRMGTTLWGNLEGYIKRSPVLKLEKITTPLLMKHGKKDGICPYSNAVEFFLGLRRTGKKAWMLAYPEAGHSLGGKDAKDFTIRMQQFFDHYLKDEPAPIWMLDGLGAKYRGIRSGLELDTTGRTPGPGLLTPEEQAKVDSLMTRKPITIILK